jgi:hypothetical protein
MASRGHAAAAAAAAKHADDDGLRGLVSSIEV